jgi:hypothetical protein
VGALTEEERKKEREKRRILKVSKTGSGSERETAMENRKNRVGDGQFSPLQPL